MPLFRQTNTNEFVPFVPEKFKDLEKDLEIWVEKNPDILLEDEDLAIIARQPRTTHGKLADLLAVDASGACVIIELKRSETPRDVVAQAMEYAAWVDSLSGEQLDGIARDYAHRSGVQAEGIADLYQAVFSKSADDEESDASGIVDRISFNHRQRIVIVAGHFSPEVEQTLRYLRTRLGVDVTGVRFGIYRAGDELIIETETVVGRERRISESSKELPTKDAWTDEQIRVHVQTDFMRSAISSIEDWVNAVNSQDLEIRHGPYSNHWVVIRGQPHLFYYYAKRWLYFSLSHATDDEVKGLSSSLSRTESLVRHGHRVRFHVANDADLGVVKEIIQVRC